MCLLAQAGRQECLPHIEYLLFGALGWHLVVSATEEVWAEIRLRNLRVLLYVRFPEQQLQHEGCLVMGGYTDAWGHEPLSRF